MVKELRWGIIGTGRIATTFARALEHADRGRLHAVASRSQENADRFGSAHGASRTYAGYDAMLRDPDVDAVYISLPNPMHAEWAIRSAEAGKHVLCEKPITLNAYDTMAVIEAARRNDVFLMEAFMYRCHPQTERLVELLRQKVIGDVRMVRASFSFKGAYDLNDRFFNNALGGGGITDLGCYTVSMVRLVAAAALGRDTVEPLEVHAAGHVGAESRVDEYTAATLLFPGDIVAEVSCGIQLAMDRDVHVFGTEGRITLPDPWFCGGREGESSKIVVSRTGEEPQEILIETGRWLYAIEADYVAENIDRREGRFPGMSWDDSLGNMKTLDRWREAIGVEFDTEKPSASTRPAHGRPLARKPDHRMRYSRIPGVDKDISRVVMGSLAFRDFRFASLMCDDFFELGGNCFDTAKRYGDAEGLLGQWVQSRDVREEVVLITKGAHTPNCYPDSVTEELFESLERLRTEYVDIYFLHRDNPDVPVGEFIDVLNEHKDAGRIKVFGGSNWTIERIEEANAYAARYGKAGFTTLSNNLSLARMVEAPWDGCLAASDPDSHSWLHDQQMPLFPWSSQARGFFADGRADPEDRSDAELARCWYSDGNFERLERAKSIAKETDATTTSVALGYVLHQTFPTFPIIGPLSPHETWTSLAALDVELTPDQTRWLDLRD